LQSKQREKGLALVVGKVCHRTGPLPTQLALDYAWKRNQCCGRRRSFKIKLPVVVVVVVSHVAVNLGFELFKVV
jgi:hypothetical protein